MELSSRRKLKLEQSLVQGRAASARSARTHFSLGVEFRQVAGGAN